MNKRLALAVNPEKNYLAIEFSLEYELLEESSFYVWTVTDGGEAVLLARIAFEGGIVEGDGMVVIKDADGNDVTDSVLYGYEKYTMYVYYNGADEVCIGCDDVDNVLYFANATCVQE